MTHTSIFGIGFTLVFIGYLKACAASKKTNRSMDRMNLHRAGLVVNKSYNDSSIHGDWDEPKDRLGNESEGVELKPTLN